MALGNTATQSDHKLYILKIKNKTLDKDTNKEIPAIPHIFQVLEKTEGKWVVKPETTTSFNGDLVKIDFEVDEWEGTEYNVIKLKFVDNESKEDYILDARCSSDFRSLANSILALDPSDTTGLRVNLYKTTSKQNGKEYSNVSLWQGEKHIKGKYTWDEMPAVEKIKFKGKDMSDTTKLDDWTITKLKEFVAQMEGKTAEVPAKAEKPAAKTKAKAKVSEEQEEVPAGMDDSVIPF